MKYEVHPLSLSVRTDISVLDFRAGIIYPSYTLGWIICSIKSVAWLEIILLASNISTLIPGEATYLSLYGVSTI